MKGRAMSDIYHILPINDIREHEESIDCWCEPEEDINGVIIHNSADGREDYEVGLKKVN
jgi:hypothetical protein